MGAGIQVLDEPKNSAAMIQWKFMDDQFVFSNIDQNGEVVKISEWNRRTMLAPKAILDEMVDNGFSKTSEDAYYVDSESLLRQDDMDRRVLGLPDMYPYVIKIDSNGQLNQLEFRFVLRFYEYVPGGEVFNVHRLGPVITINNGAEYLLSSQQYELCESLDRFNTRPDEEFSFRINLLEYSKIKLLAVESKAYLDSYLSQQELSVPANIKADFKVGEDGSLNVFPVVDSTLNTKFVKAFDTFKDIREIYPVATDEGNTKRFIIEPEKKAQLQKIKRLRKVTDKREIESIIENPTDYFTPETDLSEFFSERVVELGVYKPKFYSFVCPYKSQWVTGFAVKTPGTPELRITIKTEKELLDFEKLAQVAKQGNKEHFKWQGVDIPLSEVASIRNIAKKQFSRPKDPITEDTLDVEGKKVLIIYENADTLDYAPGYGSAIYDHHKFASIKNLAHDIILKDHQISGIAWLQTLCRAHHPGCLLADDMGLGKTLQVLYFIEWHSKHFKTDKPYLVVAPVSLLENWEAEYARFFNPCTLRVNPLRGGVQVMKDFNPTDVKLLQQRQIILTNYETLRTYQLNLCAVDYAVVVLDEAQKVKTPGTIITNVVKALKADFKIAMTGTPIENTFLDLWCIMDFSVPGLLGFAKDFASLYQDPLKDKDTNIIDLGQSLHKRLGIFMKRRMKSDVLKDLPAKILQVKKKTMPAIQIDIYNKSIEKVKSKLGSGTDMLLVLQEIKDISDHPFLNDEKLNEIDAQELIATSAKMQVTIELLQSIREAKEKVIVFADRKATQRLLQQIIRDIFNILPSIINGDTPTSRKPESANQQSRQQTIDKFSKSRGFGVIIMSPLAAGMGLNVTSANHVIHYSRYWNPAKEEQATDRAFRIGQTKQVYVYYPMAVFPPESNSGTETQRISFDEVLDKLLTRKMSLATSTLYPTEQAEVRAEEIINDLFGK